MRRHPRSPVGSRPDQLETFAVFGILDRTQERLGIAQHDRDQIIEVVRGSGGNLFDRLEPVQPPGNDLGCFAARDLFVQLPIE